MRQQTVANGFKHTHEDRPFAPPHESPLDQAARKAFGCSLEELRNRTEAVEETAFDVIHDFIYSIDAKVRERTGEKATEVVKWAIAQALVRAGSVGQYGLLTGNVDNAFKFGRDAQKAVGEAVVMAALLDG